jgi:hypothetical protein
MTPLMPKEGSTNFSPPVSPSHALDSVIRGAKLYLEQVITSLYPQPLLKYDLIHRALTIDSCDEPQAEYILNIARLMMTQSNSWQHWSVNRKGTTVSLISVSLDAPAYSESQQRHSQRIAENLKRAATE